MTKSSYKDTDLENAKRYYSSKSDFKFVENQLAEDGLSNEEIESIIAAIRKDLKSDYKSIAKKKLLTGFLVVIASGFFVLISTGLWFDIKAIGIIGILTMIYGFVRMGSGLKVLLDIEDSSFFKQFDAFKIKKKKSANNVEKKPLKKT